MKKCTKAGTLFHPQGANQKIHKKQICYEPTFIDEEIEAQKKDVIYQMHTVSGQCEI